jgi:hypothetical protein
MALYHIKSVILPGVKGMDRAARPFHILNRTAENFGDFLMAMNKDFSSREEGPSGEKTV